MRLQIFFSKTLPLCKFLQTISDNNEIQIWGFFFLASGGGPKGGKKKAQPHLPWIFQNGSLSPSSLILSPLSLWLQHILKLCNRIINHHVRSIFFPCITKSQNQLDHLVAFDQSAAALSLFLSLSLIFSLIVVVDSRRRCLLPQFDHNCLFPSNSQLRRRRISCAHPTGNRRLQPPPSPGKHQPPARGINPAPAFLPRDPSLTR